MALEVTQNTREAGPTRITFVDGRQQPPVTPAPAPEATDPTPPPQTDAPPDDEAGGTPAAADAPAEEPAAQSDDDTPAEGATDDESLTVHEHQRRRPRNRTAEARIKQLSTDKYDLIRENQRLAAERDALMRTLQGQPPASPASLTPAEHPSAPTGPAEPHPDDFEDHTAYLKAYARWELQQNLSTLRAELKAELHAEQHAERQATVQQGWTAQVAQARQAYDDFDEAFHDPTVRFRDDLAPLIHEMVGAHPQGHQLLYTLLTDPALRDALDERTPAGARKLLQTTLADLSGPRQPRQQPTSDPPARQPPARAHTPPAAAPVTPVLGQGNPGAIRQDASSIAQQRGSLGDYMKARGPYRP